MWTDRFLPDWSEVRDFIFLKLFPRRFKFRNVRRFAIDTEREVLLVGTIHQAHLTTPEYSLADVENLVINYLPDRIGIEARPEDLARGLLMMAPVEMAQTALLARQRNIFIFGFDSWQEQEYEAAADRGESPDFNDDARNDRMFQLMREGFQSGQRILVLTGYSHLSPFVKRFRHVGVEKPLTPETKEALFSSRGGSGQLNPGLLPSLESTIEYFERYVSLHPGDNAWSRRVYRKLEQLRELRRQLVERD